MNDLKILKTASNLPCSNVPLVSIVIPTYNRSNHIGDALLSAINQDFPSLEVVVCDNNSTDDTIPHVLSIVSGLDNVTILKWNKNVGPVANWHCGVEHCRGKYVKILFSDDELNIDCVSQMVANMRENVGFVYSACLVGESRSSAVSLYSDKNHKSLHPVTYRSSRGFCRYLLKKSMPVSPCSALFAKHVILKSLTESLFDPPCDDALNLGAGPDVKIFFDALISLPFYCHIPTPLVFFRCHSNSLTIGKNIAVRQSYSKCISRYSKSFPIYARILRWVTLAPYLPKKLYKLIATIMVHLKDLGNT